MLAPDTILRNRYRITQRIGGGMGELYLATDLRLGRRVVVKENRSGDPRQFRVGARPLATITHPNLPRVTDDFVEPSSAQYPVTDHVGGQSLDALVKQPVTPPVSSDLSWLWHLPDAVEYLHSRGVIPPRQINPALSLNSETAILKALRTSPLRPSATREGERSSPLSGSQRGLGLRLVNDKQQSLCPSNPQCHARVPARCSQFAVVPRSSGSVCVHRRTGRPIISAHRHRGFTTYGNHAAAGEDQSVGPSVITIRGKSQLVLT